MTDQPRIVPKQMNEPEVLVEKHGSFLYRYALFRLRDPDLAEETVQETFLAALRGQERFQCRASERAWLFGILRHKICDHFRKVSREQSLHNISSQGAGLENLFDPRGNWLTAPSKWPLDPSKSLEQKEFLETFHHCLSGLQHPLAQAFILLELEGLKREQICDLMNISATNLRVILYRARMRLRHCLQLKWFADMIEKVPAMNMNPAINSKVLP